jgi:hypothetical protein
MERDVTILAVGRDDCLIHEVVMMVRFLPRGIEEKHENLRPNSQLPGSENLWSTYQNSYVLHCDFRAVHTIVFYLKAILILFTIYINIFYVLSLFLSFFLSFFGIFS